MWPIIKLSEREIGVCTFIASLKYYIITLGIKGGQTYSIHIGCGTNYYVRVMSSTFMYFAYLTLISVKGG